MKWMIVADSSCDLKTLDTESPEIGYDTVPFVMDVDGREFVDDENISVPEMVDAMEKAEKSHSACPSPEAWRALFEKADHIIALTISGRLSGSYNSAMVGKSMTLEDHPDKKIEVIDSLSTGPKLVMLAQSALKQIQEQIPFETIVASCRERAQNARTIFTLSNFHNLVQNGRVSKIAGFIAGRLGIRVIGVGSPEGEIQLKELMRGENRTLKRIIKDMEENDYQGTPMTVCHCMNEPMAQSLKEMIVARWQSAKVQLLPTRGLDSYYAERSGLIITYDRGPVMA
ncbi:MAG: DegV family protein [Clostridia bacterium]|nr:DegV family protein [Clostridia bacterium]